MANDTFIPEMFDNIDIEQLYDRGMSSFNNSVSDGTYVPGIHDNDNAKKLPTSSLKSPIGSSQVKRDEAVVGFLYSVSRKGIGEYWPLHLGANVIGRSELCDIELKELTVSDRHAILSIKKMKTSDELIASIRDDGSKNGIFLNDEELDYDNHPCKNGDIITIGNNYQLILLLINVSQYGLKVSESFQAVPEKTKIDTPVGPKKGPRSTDTGGTIPIYGNTPNIGGDTKNM